MAMDKNDLNSLLVKVPKISKTQELAPYHRLVFLYHQLTERKKILYRAQVQVETARELAEADDTIANQTADSQIKESTAQMKALKWEINALNRLIAEHVTEHDDLTDTEKYNMGVIAEDPTKLRVEKV